MKIEEIFENVCEAIKNSTGISKSEIKLDSRLINDLNIDSIDLIDILFELETKFDIKLKVNLYEITREELGDNPLEIEGVITKEGIEAIHKYMPEIDQSRVVAGLTTIELFKLVNVQSLCNLIDYQLQKKAK